MNQMPIELILIIVIFLAWFVYLHVKMTRLSRQIDVMGATVFSMFHALENMSNAERYMLAILDDFLQYEEDAAAVEKLNSELDEVNEILKKYLII